MNVALREYDDMKEEIKNSKGCNNSSKFESNYETMLSYCLKC